MFLHNPYLTYNGFKPRKACHNTSKINLLCSLCIIERKNSRTFKSPNAIYHHVITEHKDWNNTRITKKGFIKILDGLSKSIDLGVVLGVIQS